MCVCVRGFAHHIRDNNSPFVIPGVYVLIYRRATNFHTVPDTQSLKPVPLPVNYVQRNYTICAVPNRVGLRFQFANSIFGSK